MVHPLGWVHPLWCGASVGWCIPSVEWWCLRCNALRAPLARVRTWLAQPRSCSRAVNDRPTSCPPRTQDARQTAGAARQTRVLCESEAHTRHGGSTRLAGRARSAQTHAQHRTPDGKSHAQPHACPAGVADAGLPSSSSAAARHAISTASEPRAWQPSACSLSSPLQPLSPCIRSLSPAPALRGRRQRAGTQHRRRASSSHSLRPTCPGLRARTHAAAAGRSHERPHAGSAAVAFARTPSSSAMARHASSEGASSPASPSPSLQPRQPRQLTLQLRVRSPSERCSLREAVAMGEWWCIGPGAAPAASKQGGRRHGRRRSAVRPSAQSRIRGDKH